MSPTLSQPPTTPRTTTSASAAAASASAGSGSTSTRAAAPTGTAPQLPRPGRFLLLAGGGISLLAGLEASLLLLGLPAPVSLARLADFTAWTPDQADVWTTEGVRQLER